MDLIIDLSPIRVSVDTILYMQSARFNPHAHQRMPMVAPPACSFFAPRDILRHYCIQGLNDNLAPQIEKTYGVWRLWLDGQTQSADCR